MLDRFGAVLEPVDYATFTLPPPHFPDRPARSSHSSTDFGVAHDVGSLYRIDYTPVLLRLPHITHGCYDFTLRLRPTVPVDCHVSRLPDCDLPVTVYTFVTLAATRVCCRSVVTAVVVGYPRLRHFNPFIWFQPRLRLLVLRYGCCWWLPLPDVYGLRLPYVAFDSRLDLTLFYGHLLRFYG